MAAYRERRWPDSGAPAQDWMNAPPPTRGRSSLSSQRSSIPHDPDTRDVPAFLPSYTERDTAAQWLATLSLVPEVAEYKALSLDLLNPAPGETVLDLGCGVGDDARALATRVSPGGTVIGLDVDPQLIAIAGTRQSLAPEMDVSLYFVVGSAERLAYPPDHFDAVRVDRVLQHTGSPGEVLNELWRVLKPGGKVLIVEPDWKTMSVYPGSAVGGDDDSILATVFHWHVSHTAHPTVGRQLRSLLAGAGFDEVNVFARAYCSTQFAVADLVMELAAGGRGAVADSLLSIEEVESWLEAARTAEAEGRFFATLPLIFAHAVKPMERE